MTQSAIALSIVALAVVCLAWRLYRALKRSACCGSCGCNLMSPKAKQKMLAKRKAAAKPKDPPATHTA